ncbi:MAG TPA: cupredoxin domain-containing protein [Acidimicrobiia bacterium]|nr:cupredoxin domain-containing protein [Acidimicrobiia bacterium]
MRTPLEIVDDDAPAQNPGRAAPDGAAAAPAPDTGRAAPDDAAAAPAPDTGRAAPHSATGGGEAGIDGRRYPQAATGRALRWARLGRSGTGAPARVVVAAAVAGAALAAGGVWIALPGGAPAPRTILVTAHHSRFEPDRITVKAGATVWFVVHNSDPIDHEFIIGPPAVHELHERGTPHVHTGVVPGEITVPAGATVETTWTFGPSGSPPVAYGCHLAGHWAYGMHGLAVIR